MPCTFRKRKDRALSGKNAGSDGTRLYLQVLAAIRERISNGTYRDRLPAEKALAEELGVAQGTVAHALRILKEDQVLVSRDSRGTEINWQTPGSGERMST
jgi:DNA-binding GntR family transcriptional regulator